MHVLTVIYNYYEKYVYHNYAKTDNSIIIYKHACNFLPFLF